MIHSESPSTSSQLPPFTTASHSHHPRLHSDCQKRFHRHSPPSSHITDVPPGLPFDDTGDDNQKKKKKKTSIRSSKQKNLNITNPTSIKKYAAATPRYPEHPIHKPRPDLHTVSNQFSRARDSELSMTNLYKQIKTEWD